MQICWIDVYKRQMVRPSYVLGGRGMEVVYDDEALTFYMQQAVGVTPDLSLIHI